MAEDWQKLEAEKAAQIIAAVNPHLSPVPFNPEETTVRTRAMSFYKGYELCEMTDLSAIPAARKYAIYRPGEVHVIDWTNNVIYNLNDSAPIHLDARTVCDYARFFFGYVRGRHGRFLIIESIDDIRWQIEPPLQGRKVMQEMLAPISVISHEDGIFTLEAFMIFKDSLFKTQIHIKEDGLVSMSKEELKVEGMPVLQDAAA